MSPTATFGEVVARRELDVDGTSSKVIVELAKPVSDGRDSGCSFRLAYREQEYVRAIYGVDAFQALMLALKTVSVHLKHDDWLPRDRMYWLEPGNGTGFPNPDIE